MSGTVDNMAGVDDRVGAAPEDSYVYRYLHGGFSLWGGMGFSDGGGVAFPLCLSGAGVVRVF